MGTLTAGQPRLSHYCEHKLPTSCRLSSIGDCCACADERSHSITGTYPKYIDGQGYLLTGKRWDRYCWFCKEFWENRVHSSGLPHTRTRIPAVPSQDEFLKLWYEFHQGYRIVHREDGSEDRVAVLGEDFRDVSPGCLPRTLDELREGRERSAAEERLRAEQEANTIEETAPVGPSLEETLDQMFQLAVAEEEAPQPSQQRQQQQQQQPQVQSQRQNQGSNVHAQAMVAAGTRSREYQARRVAALRRELHRMRNGIERVIQGLREIGENVPDPHEATGALQNLGQTIDELSGIPSAETADRALQSVNSLTTAADASQTDRSMMSLQGRIDEARSHVNEARRMRDQAASELDTAEHELRTSQRRLQQVQRDQRTAENYMRIFGTREEMMAQGDDYVSPLGGMFERAEERFNAAEQVRRETRTLRQVLRDEERAGGEESTRQLEELERRERDVWGVPRPPPAIPQLTSSTTGLMEMARDEVWAGQSLSGSPEQTHGTVRGSDDMSPEPREEGEQVLEEYYDMLRSQGWSQSETPSQRQIDIEQRLRDYASRRQRNDNEAPMVTIETPDTRRLDVLYILRAIVNDSSLRHTPYLPDWAAGEASAFNAAPDNYHLHPQYEELLQNTDLVWNTGLPAERARRAHAQGSTYLFTSDPASVAPAENQRNVELIAGAFMASAEVRRQTFLRPTEQLQILYRLQAGRREAEDRAVLERLLVQPEVVHLAEETLRQQMGTVDATAEQQRADYDQQRRQMARVGNRTRLELNEQRLATQAFALAAGRTAMQTGPDVLLNRMGEQDVQTREALRRMREMHGDDIFSLRGQPVRPGQTSGMLRDVHEPSNYVQFSPSDSEAESEDDEPQGLDAKDSGRPEPRTDEEMTVKLACAVCYSLPVSVIYIPCGHAACCEWCSEYAVPTMLSDRTRPRRAAGCPICRKAIRTKHVIKFC